MYPTVCNSLTETEVEIFGVDANNEPVREIHSVVPPFFRLFAKTSLDVLQECIELVANHKLLKVDISCCYVDTAAKLLNEPYFACLKVELNKHSQGGKCSKILQDMFRKHTGVWFVICNHEFDTRQRWSVFCNRSCLPRPKDLQVCTFDLEQNTTTRQIICASFLAQRYCTSLQQFTHTFPQRGEPAYHTCACISAEITSTESATEIDATTFVIALAACNARITRKESSLLRQCNTRLAGALLHARCASTIKHFAKHKPQLRNIHLKLYRKPIQSRHFWHVVVCNAESTSLFTNQRNANATYSPCIELAIVLCLWALVDGAPLHVRNCDFMFNHGAYADLNMMAQCLQRHNMTQVLPVLNYVNRGKKWNQTQVVWNGVGVLDTQIELNRIVVQRSIPSRNGYVSNMPLQQNLTVDKGPDSLANICMHDLHMHKSSADFNILNNDMLQYCLEDSMLSFCVERSSWCLQRALLLQENAHTWIDEFLRPNGLPSKQNKHFWKMNMMRSLQTYCNGLEWTESTTIPMQLNAPASDIEVTNTGRALWVFEIDLVSAYPSVLETFNICETTLQEENKVLPQNAVVVTDAPGGDTYKQGTTPLPPTVAIFHNLRKLIRQNTVANNHTRFYSQQRACLKQLANAMIGCMKTNYFRTLRNIWGATKMVMRKVKTHVLQDYYVCELCDNVHCNLPCSRLQPCTPCATDLMAENPCTTHLMTATDAAWFSLPYNCNLESMAKTTNAIHQTLSSHLAQGCLQFTIETYFVYQRHPYNADSYFAFPCKHVKKLVHILTTNNECAVQFIFKVCKWKGKAYNSSANHLAVLEQRHVAAQSIIQDAKDLFA